MAERDEISVDADGIPSAAGTDTVPTLAVIRDRLDMTIASVDAVEAAVDGLEALITSTNTKLDTAITALQIIDNMTFQLTALNSGVNGVTVPRVTLTSDDIAVGAVVTAIANSGIGVVDDSAFSPGVTPTVPVGMFADEASTDSVDEGDLGAPRMTLDRKQIMTLQPHTLGGLSVFRSLDLDETEEDVKTSPGCLYKLRVTNRTNSVRYVKLYNDIAANVTVGTTTPLDTIPIPANASDYTVLTENFGGVGLQFSVALSMAATTGPADSDTGAPGTNDLIASAYYK